MRHRLSVPSKPRSYVVTLRFRVREGPFDRDECWDVNGPMEWRKRHSVSFVRRMVRDAISSAFGNGLRKKGPLFIHIVEVEKNVDV